MPGDLYRAKRDESRLSNAHFSCYTTTGRVRLLHQCLIQETDSTGHIRDFALFDSELEGAFATFGGEELYLSNEEKGVRMWVLLIGNHAFVDSKKPRM